MGSGQGTAERPWHALTWVVWAVAATATLQLAPSPVYVLLVIVVAFMVVQTHGGSGGYARAFPVLVGAAAVFMVLRVALTALTTHGGPHVLWTWPALALPDWLGGFTVGGTIEAPVVAQAAAEGFVVVGVIAVFAALNAVVSHHELVQVLPRAFHEVGLILAVGIAFVPSTITAVRDVRAADRARTGGRVVRRGRLVRQIVPVLDLGLERAITLSESMDSRGFARGATSRRDQASGWIGLAGITALGAAFVALVAGRRGLAVALTGGGVVAVIGAIAVASAATGRDRYRPRRLRASDLVVMAGVCLSPVLLVIADTTGDRTLTWVASPLRWPGLHAVPV
ncbi:MAG: hypothetical protein WCI50_12300, partial [Actinomycetes bacterium]